MIKNFILQRIILVNNLSRLSTLFVTVAYTYYINRESFKTYNIERVAKNNPDNCDKMTH